MPIFIVTEQVMNGTVTMSTIVTGIEAADFMEAKTRLLITLSEKVPEFEVTRNEFEYVSYKITSGDMPVYGTMKGEPLKCFENDTETRSHGSLNEESKGRKRARGK